jgi:hypothetical protein
MVLCLGATALGLYNVYGGDEAVVKLAETTACRTERCSFNLLRKQRSPISQSYTFQVRVTEKGRDKSATADVECRRAFVLAGEFTCRLTSGGLPAP